MMTSTNGLDEIARRLELIERAAGARNLASPESLTQQVCEAATHIKETFFDEGFKSDAAWATAVETLERLAQIDPDATRRGLRHHFSSKGHALSDYRARIANQLGADGHRIVDQLVTIARALVSRGRARIAIVNATFQGGGVAEMMQTAGPILAQLGIDIEWHIIYPTRSAFYDVTKAIHNTIQGRDTVLTDEQLDLWAATGQRNARILEGVLRDPTIACVFLEDPQVVPMVAHLKQVNPEMPLVWRKHIDISGIRKGNPGAIKIWQRILGQLGHLSPRDVALFQPGHVPDDLEGYRCQLFTQYPGIDVLSRKNDRLDPEEVATRVAHINDTCHTTIDTDKTYLVVGSRFDYWKGLVSFARAFERVAGEFPDVNLIIFGNYANDDPEGVTHFEILKRLQACSRFAERIELVYNHSGREIGALYRLAAMHQMPYCAPSIAEGYNLMTDEAAAQGAVPFTSESGGLGRYPPGMWRVDIADIAAELDDAATLYDIRGADGPTLHANDWAITFEGRIADKLRGQLTLRRHDARAYAAAYQAASTRAQSMALRYSLISMLTNYLALALADASTLLRAVEGNELSGGAVSVDVVRRLVSDPADA